MGACGPPSPELFSRRLLDRGVSADAGRGGPKWAMSAEAGRVSPWPDGPSRCTRGGGTYTSRGLEASSTVAARTGGAQQGCMREPEGLPGVREVSWLAGNRSAEAGPGGGGGPDSGGCHLAGCGAAAGASETSYTTASSYVHRPGILTRAPPWHPHMCTALAASHEHRPGSLTCAPPWQPHMSTALASSHAHRPGILT